MLPAGVPNEKRSTAFSSAGPAEEPASPPAVEPPSEPQAAVTRAAAIATASIRIRISSPLTGVIQAMFIFN